MEIITNSDNLTDRSNASNVAYQYEEEHPGHEAEVYKLNINLFLAVHAGDTLAKLEDLLADFYNSETTEGLALATRIELEKM